MKNKDNLFLTPAHTIADALKAIEANRKEIVFAVDKNRRLIATITDGDLRRALIAGCGNETCLGDVIQIRKKKLMRKPVSATVGTSRDDLLRLMRRLKIRHTPLVDRLGKVVSLVTLDELLFPEPIDCSALILAGGYGSRLRPLTHHTPKPMLPINGKPVLQLIIDQIAASGIRQIYVAGHYQLKSFENYLGQADAAPISLKLIKETKPLGTAGAIGLLPKLKTPLLVVNGDVLTKMLFLELYKKHLRSRSFITVGVKEYRQQIPYGVIHCSGEQLSAIEEKPTRTVLINAGIYLLDPAVQSLVRKGARLDMTDLVTRTIRRKKKVSCFKIDDLWIDIGNVRDFSSAQEFGE